MAVSNRCEPIEYSGDSGKLSEGRWGLWTVELSDMLKDQQGQLEMDSGEGSDFSIQGAKGKEVSGRTVL